MTFLKDYKFQLIPIVVRTDRVWSAWNKSVDRLQVKLQSLHLNHRTPVISKYGIVKIKKLAIRDF